LQLKSLPKKLVKKLENRKASNSFRSLSLEQNKVDFSSNDYIGFSKNCNLTKIAQSFLNNNKNGATGSRLLSGNHYLYEQTEQLIANFHKQESALIFNSGYNANVGFFSSIPQRGDVVFYDELIHASIRDGLAMGLAKNFNFKHNNLEDLALKVQRWKNKNKGTIYIVTESVFSMDGDSSDLLNLALFCGKNKLYLVVDEAHALGVFGNDGCGLVQHLNLQDNVFAQIITFGKGLGCHGAAILGSIELKNYLTNFSRSLIYTTALPPHAVASIKAGYTLLQKESDTIKKLRENIFYFKEKIKELHLKNYFIESNSSIHCCVIPGVTLVKKIAHQLQQQGFDVKAILSPTIPKGKERLRFCLHSYNTRKEIETILKLVSKFLNV